MSTRFYHPAWKVYGHTLIEELPSIKASSVQLAIREFIERYPDASQLRQYCGACYRSAKGLERCKKVLTPCPPSCPESCPNHQQLQIFAENP